MKRIIMVLMERDGMTLNEAKAYCKEGMACVYEAIAEGDYEGAEMEFEDYFGLEPDFLMDAIA